MVMCLHNKLLHNFTMLCNSVDRAEFYLHNTSCKNCCISCASVAR